MSLKLYQLFITAFLFLIIKTTHAQDFINANYSFGLKATNVGANDMADAYSAWKNSFLKTCDNGRFRVEFQDAGQTVSEGIAYGMLLAAYANDQEAFDGMWLYYQDNTNFNGVMNWKIQGCNNAIGQNGATDAELDAAYALMVADKRWGNDGAINYNQDAKTLIQTIKDHEVEAGTNVLKPGDVWGGSNNTNPSYFATGYFRAYGEYTDDVAFWNAVADKSYDIINKNLTINNAKFNLVSDWTKADGNYSTEVPWATDLGRSYSYDAARTPWRAAIDYVWYGDSDALSYSNLCNDFVNSVGGFDNIFPGYRQDGTPISTDFKDPVFTGAYALAAMASGDQNFVNAAYTELKNQAKSDYFSATLRVIYMFGMSGNLFNTQTVTLSANDFSIKPVTFKMFPNPVDANINLSFATNELHKVAIYDINGRRLYNKVFKTPTANINVNTFSQGMYVVSVNGSYIKFTKK
ncbi:glycosyl hydrolase family 8 [uncultured Algibacter sp.]|uniref:glycosyl hydrolase family 8 n=1 Tax=uncultured Algibacter sp. TaxID=298659 RepID=UPI0032165689